jgi:protein TonB
VRDQPWYERPLVLATAGSLAIHLFLAVLGDAFVVTHPYVPERGVPHVELVDVELPEPPPLPGPATPAATPKTAVPVVVQKVRATAVRATAPPRAEPLPILTPATANPAPGGPVVQMDLGADASGHVAVAVGHPTDARVGKGGSGGGTGAGSGSSEAAPMSVATIKTRALPRGDYGYIDAGKDYPPEARQLGIEGPVRVRLVVDDRGNVTSAVLLNRLGHGLDELALRKARDIAFDPARDTDDHPVTSVVVWTFHMTLPK